MKTLKSEDVVYASGLLVTFFVVGLLIMNYWQSDLLPIVAAVLVVYVFSFLAYHRAARRQTKVILFCAEAACIITLYFILRVDFLGILSIVWIVQATELFSPKQSAWLLLGSVSVSVASQLYHVDSINIFDGLVSSALYGLFQLFALGASLRAIRERQLREETGTLNRELIATRELLSQTIAQGERLRIARNLHDILGHHMTALILNLEVANHSVQGENQQKAQEKVEQSLAMAKLLLGDIRSAVSELRDEDTIDLLSSIEKLTTGIPNLEFSINFNEALPINNVELAETILRCTQEAITNVLRHSNATQCDIVVAEKEGNCVLTVADNGSGRNEINPGNGLNGMVERVRARGGDLKWKLSEMGFSLQVELPALVAE